LTLDPAGGQVYTLRSKAAGVTLDSPLTLHWNPDPYEPNRSWPHPFDWDPAPKVTFERGPVFFEMARSGTLKGLPEVLFHVTHRLYANAPYLWTRTLIEIVKDVPLSCLRSDEMAFKEAHFTHLLWQERGGRVVSRPLAELRPINKHGDVMKVGPETPWVGFAHPEKGYAVASLRLRAANVNRLGRPLRLRDYSTYLIKSESMKGLYWMRPLIYWPQHTKRDQLLVATAGSLYLEESAYYLAAAALSDSASTAERLSAEFTAAHDRLTHPIYAEAEDEQTEGIRG
jgi:hypothetical protein